MKVVSISDAAGGPACQSYLLCEALKMQGVDAVDISFRKNYIGYPHTEGSCLQDANAATVKNARRFIKEADFYIIHNYDSGYLGKYRTVIPTLRIGGFVNKHLKKKPIDVKLAPNRHIVRLHGSDAVRANVHLLAHYQRHNTLFVGSPDVRLWDKVPGVHWIPPLMDLGAMEEAMKGVKSAGPFYEEKGTVVVNHSPTDRSKKGTSLLTDAIGLLRERGVSAYADMTTMKPWGESLLHKKACDVYFDQVFYGMYGVSSIEALLLGKPVMVGLSGWTKSWMGYKSEIFANVSTSEDIAHYIEAYGKGNLASSQLYEWAEHTHGLKHVGYQWRCVLEEVSKR